MKKLFAILLTLMLLTSCALAWSGSTEAAETVTVLAPASGNMEWNDLHVGQRVAAGDALGSIAAQKVFSKLDGTVQHVQVAVGEKVEGTVLEIFPSSRYEIRCSIEGAKQEVETTLVHSGEEVWLRCTKDGSHRAVGRITVINDTEYTVEALGGELYVGEVVNVYRDEAFTDSLKIGYGTVLETDTVAVESTGFITRIRVTDGAAVQRGQWIYSVLDTPDGSINAPVDGVVTQIAVENGNAASLNQALLTIATSVQLTAEIDAEEAAQMHVGNQLNYIRADESEDQLHPCTIESIGVSENSGKVKVIFCTEETTLPIGMTITIEE